MSVGKALAKAVFVLDIRSSAARIDSESGENMEPFQQEFVVVLAAGIANGGEFETVPAGKRAVIEHVSVDATGRGSEKADYLIKSTIGDNSTFREFPIITKVGAIGVIGSQPVRAFAAPGTQFGAVVRRLDTAERIGATFVITGNFIPVP